MKRFLGFDFGINHIGVAVGSTLTGTAEPLPALPAKDGIPDRQQLDSVFKQWPAAGAVVGLPLNMDGSDQELTLRARKFGRRLQAWYQIQVYFQDERLTTVAARSELFERGGFKALKNKAKLDSASAVLILEDFLAGAAD